MIDLFRAGKAPEIVRRKAAEGMLSLPPPEKIEILVFLTTLDDETLRSTAYATLQSWKPDELVKVLSDPATSAAVLEFAVNQMVPGRKEIADGLLGNPSLPDNLRDSINQTIALETTVPPSPETPTSAAKEPAADKSEERETLLQRIGRMTAAEKIKTALTGNQEERLVLIRDANKIVARSVLQSPKLSDLEIENIASMKNVSEEVLRLIAMNRKFMKTYAVMRALINNPRSPIDITLPLLNRLNERDLKGVMINKNVPDVLRGMALKSVKQKEEANKPKVPGKKH